ncbi:hypothetical protein MPEAHAMD_6780 [Methylobacterium frigidaeris]|uniref:Putative Flp pilus-assembly TadG-like N-terminal domain-containing protein n=2 Tax=Methylobacterium frigidaeris TaxID=2038277 RepID=A0AA37HI69_9HYPH|nr:hypothetical protein MPEAHAMD_6780 [Methylobacterium frigidaeris]
MNFISGFADRRNRFLRCQQGTVFVLFGLLLPVVGMAAVGVAEIAEVMLARSKLQNNADAAALQGAGEFGIDQSAATTERTRLYADTMAGPLRLRWKIVSTASIDPATRAVTVQQKASRASFFGSLLPPGGWNLSASATAIRTARKPLCVLGAQAGSLASIELQGRSAITANDCLVQSNANLTAVGSATVWAGEARAVGSASGSIRPNPVTDAPAVQDPFAAMKINVPLLCDSLSLSLGSGTFYLNPGVHCGAIALLGNANLVLAPGEHYFVGPSFSVGGNTTISGNDVVVILKGLMTAQITGSAVLQLEGRKSGPYAGFVLISDPSYAGEIEISTSNARKLLGTVYLPNADLTVKGNNNKVADQSPWTVVVARTVRMEGSANLTINSNYAGSNVPVPVGVGPPRDQPVRLSQ